MQNTSHTFRTHINRYPPYKIRQRRKDGSEMVRVKSHTDAWWQFATD